MLFTCNVKKIKRCCSQNGNVDGMCEGPFTPSVSVNAAMTLAILFSLKSVESLENRLQPHSGANPLFSMRTELQALSLGMYWCLVQMGPKLALNKTNQVLKGHAVITATLDEECSSFSVLSAVVKKCSGSFTVNKLYIIM